MKVIAKSDVGYLIQASQNEIKRLLKAQGEQEPEPRIGAELNVHDYLGTMEKAKSMASSYGFQKLEEKAASVYGDIKEIRKTLPTTEEK